MTILWNTVEQYVTVVMSVFQFSPDCNFVTFISFGLSTVRSESINTVLLELNSGSSSVVFDFFILILILVATGGHTALHGT